MGPVGRGGGVHGAGGETTHQSFDAWEFRRLAPSGSDPVGTKRREVDVQLFQADPHEVLHVSIYFVHLFDLFVDLVD